MAYVTSLLFALVMISSAYSMAINSRDMTLDQVLMQANGHMEEMMNPSGAIMPDGTRRKLFEIDIMMSMEDGNETISDGERVKRKADRNPYRRWPAGRIPYEISSDFSDQSRSIIMDAIEDYHKYTCLRFVPSNTDTDRIMFIRTFTGCWAYVGRQGGVQNVSIGFGCDRKSIVLHELGHAVGLWHEQSRPDRDEYVTILTENIYPEYLHAFNKYEPWMIDTYGVPYDYTSLMHYSQYAFSAIWGDFPSIRAHDPFFQSRMGHREDLSFLDLKIISLMYECPAVNGCAARDCGAGWWTFQGPDCECWCCSQNYLTFSGEPFFRC